MSEFVKQIMAGVREYSFWDYVWFKTGLISLGIILGSYFSTFFLEYIVIVWFVFAITTVFITYRTFSKIK